MKHHRLSPHEALLELDIASTELCTAIAAFARGDVPLAEVERRRAYRDEVFAASRRRVGAA